MLITCANVLWPLLHSWKGMVYHFCLVHEQGLEIGIESILNRPTIVLIYAHMFRDGFPT